MAENTSIEWTEHSFNPWEGCVKVSPGCKHCYAQQMNKRFGGNNWGPDSARLKRKEDYWKKAIHWNAKAQKDGARMRIFLGSMMDFLEDRPDVVAERKRTCGLIEQTPNLDWLMLTKRPENARKLLPAKWFSSRVSWPANLWFGTTMENQQMAETRMRHLLAVPAPVHFISAEPLLGAIDFLTIANFIHVDWVIVGGESGPWARPMHSDWVRQIRNQCDSAGVNFFFKQWGGKNKKKAGRELDGRTWDEFPETIVTRRAEVQTNDQ